MTKHKIFIVHCENNFGPTDYAIRIINIIGCIPVIAEKEPKLSRSVGNLAFDTMDSCDAVIVIATPDRDGPEGREPSSSVSIEIGGLRKTDKFKGRYVVIKEESVVLSPMMSETWYKFSMTDYAPIAEAILIELNSMGLFRNYYEIPGSELDIHLLMESLFQLRDLRKKGIFKKEIFKQSVEDAVKEFVDKLTKEE